MSDTKQKIVAIVGPTASGKTELAMKLAEEFDAEIVCADSRTVYAGMDIGTAKPSAKERKRIRHHLLDVVSPEEPMSAAMFKRLADNAIQSIEDQGKLSLLVGGSGLYVYSVIYDFQFPAGAHTEERARLEREPLEALVSRLKQEDPERALEIDIKNRRRVIRALETLGQPRERKPILPHNVLLLGLRAKPEQLDDRIRTRTKMMIEAGLVEEVRQLVERYGSGLEVLKSPGYEEILPYLEGSRTLQEVQELIDLHTRQLVKRQLTWLKRNHEIHWLDSKRQNVFSQAKGLIANFIG